MTDPIADMLNVIRNAQMVNKPTVEVLFSNIKFEMAKILEREGFIEKAEKKGKKTKKNIEITLKFEDKIPAISGAKVISKLGQRMYASYRDLRRVRDGYGIAIISTSKGLMTNKEARKQKIGGEIICEIW